MHAAGLRTGLALAAAAAAATWDPVESAVILALLFPPAPRFASAVAAVAFSAYRARVLPCALAHLFPSKPSALWGAAGASAAAALWIPLWHAPVAAALACIAAGGVDWFPDAPSAGTIGDSDRPPRLRVVV